MKSTHDVTADSYLVTHFVDEGSTGGRLDSFLKARYRHRSRQQIQAAIDEGIVTIKRAKGAHLQLGKIKASLQLQGGDEVLVLSERRPEPKVCFDYKTIYEDDHLMVIEKPANLPVHPSGRYFFNTLLIHLRTQGHKTPLGADREYFLPHRIDKETSGVLCLARGREACAALVKQFVERSTEKRYLAVVHGIPPEEFRVDAPLMRAKNSEIALKMAVGTLEEGAQTALTTFKRLETHTNSFGTFSLVECFPKTGRQHQIRVHLDHAGHPILGDKLYGMPDREATSYYERKHLTPEAQARLIIPRHALHAASLEFEHPVTLERMSFDSGLPEDLRGFLDGTYTPAPFDEFEVYEAPELLPVD